MKATVENPRGSVEKLSLKESVKGAHTVLRGFKTKGAQPLRQGCAIGSVTTP